jgi:hypothetical protein
MPTSGGAHQRWCKAVFRSGCSGTTALAAAISTGFSTEVVNERQDVDGGLT